MKNGIHHLGEEHKKKKNFFVYVENQKIKKNYSDYTLKKVAKKVAKDLLGSKEKIIFHLEEKGKSGKTYGPYIGSQKGQKIEVKTYKMSGGLNGEIKNKIPGNSNRIPGNSNRIPGNSNRIPGNLEKPIQETFTLSAESISEGNRANRILHQNSTINPNSARARNNVAQAAQLAANAANSALLAVNEAQQTNNPGAKLAAANALNTAANVVANITANNVLSIVNTVNGTNNKSAQLAAANTMATAANTMATTANVIATITSNNALLAVNAAQQANNKSATNVLQQTNNQGEQLAAAANALNTAAINALLAVNATQQINNQGVKMAAVNNLNAAVSSLSIAANNVLNSN